jgi:hypothetical protein
MYGLTNEALTDEELAYVGELSEKYGYHNSTLSSTDEVISFQLVLREQLNVESVVEVLAVIALAVVGLVFMWWGVRKITSALMKAFKKGKISL